MNTEEESVEKSIEELMSEAYHLALDICYETTSPDGVYFDIREPKCVGFLTKQILDDAWGWADGLFQKYYEKIESGKCSLRATIDFDVGKFEEEVKKHVEVFKKVLEKLPPVHKLTTEEMRTRGYRGSWAGYTEEEDALYYINYYENRISKLKEELKGVKNYDTQWTIEREITGCERCAKELREKLEILRKIT